jgi:hypothetical protein
MQDSCKAVGAAPLSVLQSLHVLQDALCSKNKGCESMAAGSIAPKYNVAFQREPSSLK